MLGLGPLNSYPMNTLPLMQGAAVVVPDSQTWRLRVLIGGVDVSDRLTGRASVEAEENAARLCSINMLPEPGVIELDQWTGKPLQFWRQRLEGETVASEFLWFSGWAQKPVLNINTHVLGLVATCERQRRLADMTLDQVRELVGGDYAVGVFGEPDDAQRYAADLLSTRPYSLDCGPDGAFRLTAWAAKAVPDYTLTADEVVDGSLGLELVTADQLINQIQLTVEYRYQRLRHREYSFNWTHPGANFCGWLAMDTELPTLSMLQSALDQANWSQLSLQYEALPPTGPNPCGGGGVWINRWSDPHLLSFSARVAARSSQSLTESYPITLSASGSIAAYGLRTQAERYSDDIEFDGRDWENQSGGRPAGSVQDELGDWIIDKGDAERRGDLLRTAMAVEVTRMFSQHRLNRVRLQVPVGDQVFDLVHTVYVRALGIQAQGKAARVVATWDHDAGTEVVDLELAISRAGMSVEPTPLQPPERPLFDFGIAPPSSGELSTQLGGRPESPPFNTEQDGFAGNYRWLFPGAETYPRRLQITTPEIPAEHRDPVTGERSASYTVDIPNDLLVMEVL
ncbi:hypothetical protein [Ectopseudomonas hydrolytica]|uniref:hypothetical protein n=1 Tax=Ectopseudomonas hydrolytica TaxID=2493633 RepID=UPI00376F30BC